MESSIATIITCYNEGDLIYRALNSLTCQTDTDFEIILVNDCSQDIRTNQICDELSLLDNITLIKNNINLGLSGARNKAIELMHRDIAVFLDADDVLPENAIHNIRYAFDNCPEADFVYGNYVRMGGNENQIINCQAITSNEGFLSPVLLADNWILLGTSPFRKRLWEKIGGYSMDYSNTCQDLDFWQRALLYNAKGVYVCDQIYIWNRSDSGMNTSLAHIKSVDVCNNRNINFFIRYCTRYDESFLILYRNKNFKGIKNWALNGLKHRKFSLVYLIIYISPFLLIPLISKIYLHLKRL
jgi:glycosyltransferase involved in cell wall biosynthesis